MLTLLKISNVALIDDLSVEFGDGLNLLTGETGSGKSIIVDSLGALTGERVSNDIIRQGAETARIEGLFSIVPDQEIISLLDESGIETEGLTGTALKYPARGPRTDTQAPAIELIVRRELSATGRNRVFVNDQLITQSFLKQLGPYLAEIHGQGEQASLYDVASHLAMLDQLADAAVQIDAVRTAYRDLSSVRDELASLESDESEKLQLLDILRFQVDEIGRAALVSGEDAALEDEKRRLNNVEKLSALSGEAFDILYDAEHSSLATLDRAAKIVAELAEYDERFRGFEDSLESARAVAAELGSTARDFASSLEFSPERLDQIEERLAEIARLKRKYGDSIETVLEHLRVSEERLAGIETAEFREEELRNALATCEVSYRKAAKALHDARVSAAAKFAKKVETQLADVALDKARFEIRVEAADTVSADGSDRVEFFFSANPGEPPRPLARVASGGEASRLMLILKTVARRHEHDRASVFDEVDIGIGGRVADAVGKKLRSLAADQQVLCVTHQPQIASLADRHFVVEKETAGEATAVTVRELTKGERIDEIARMLAGEQITEQARENAKAMLAAAR